MRPPDLKTFFNSVILDLTLAIDTVFWSWFPIGSCGVRTVLLFISSLVIFVLRVGQMHLGSRTTTSSFATLKYLFPLQVAQTFAWYLFSAWWFTEIYIWSSSTGAHLEMVNRGR
jgi:nucleoporin NDC1